MFSGIIVTLGFFYLVSVLYVAADIVKSKPWNNETPMRTIIAGVAFNAILAPALICWWIKEGK